MAEHIAHKRVKQDPGIIAQIIKALLLSILCSIIVEWLLIYFYRPEFGATYAKQVMMQEFNWFSTDFQQSLLISSPVTTVQYYLALTNEWLFVKSGIKSWLSSTSKTGISLWLYKHIAVYVEAMLYVIMTFIIRLIIIVLTTPLFILVALVGLTDGLVQRDLRKFGFGRESAFKYHHAKRAITPSLLIFAVVYLSLPFSLHPSFLLVPSAFLFGLTIYLAIFNFKKYL